MELEPNPSMATLTLPSIDVITAKQRRLAQLELRAATYGIDTPAEVAVEISDLRKEIAATAPATIAESHTILYDLLQETRADVRRLYWLLPLLFLLVIIAVKL